MAQLQLVEIMLRNGEKSFDHVMKIKRERKPGEPEKCQVPSVSSENKSHLLSQDKDDGSGFPTRLSLFPPKPPFLF